MVVGPGDVVHMRSGGGGGLGDPLERDPSRVAADVLTGLLDAARAERVYGVVLAGDAVDEVGTSAARERLLAERRSWPADPDGGHDRVRRTRAADRLAELGGWCQGREDVEIVERAAASTGELVEVTVHVRDD